MPSFWSRAPQSHICSSCKRECFRRSTGRGQASRIQTFHADAMNRRLTATSVEASLAMAGSRPARRTRKKVGASDVFTALYTTIMATAAVADADWKDRRRRDLDQQLEEARRDLARVLRESSALDYSLTLGSAAAGSDSMTTDDSTISAPTVANTPTTTSRHSVVEGIKSICVPPAQLRHHIAETKQREAYLTWLHSQFGLSRRWWTQRPAPDAGLDAIEAAQLEDEMASEITHLHGQREPQSGTQFAKMTEATNQLVDELITEAHRLASPNDPAAQKFSMESFDSPWSAMRMLRSEGYPRFLLPDLDPAATTSARLEVNEAARNIFQSWKDAIARGAPRPSPLALPPFGLRKKAPPANWYDKEIKFWVAKLCYNMLVCSVPPGIHNYNALILGFTSVGQHTLAQLVADSFLYQTRLLPTQQTLVCLLHQARAQGNLVGFHRVLRRLVGLDPRGIKIRRRAVPDVAHYRPHHEWARSHDVTLAAGYVVQRADIDGPVLEAVLSGLLSLDQVRHAAVVFASFLTDCTKVDAGTLNRLMNCVLDAVDIPAARALLRGFTENAGLITALLMSEERSARKLAIKIRLLLSIASAPEPPLRKTEMDDQMQDDPQRELPHDDQQPLLQGKQLSKAQRRKLRKFPKPPPTKAITESQLSDTAGGYLDDGYSDDSDDDYSYGSGTYRLTCALFVSDTQQYLARLAQIIAAAQGALAADVAEFMMTASSWSVQFANLAEQPHKRHHEQQQYRRMAQLKAVDQTAEAAFAACAHVMESFLEAVAEDSVDETDTQPVVGTFSSIFQSFLQRTSVPFGVRFATYCAATEAAEAAEAADSLSKQTALLERHLTEDTPVVSALLEGRLKEVILQALFPEEESTFESSMALKQRAREMSLDVLVETRVLRSQLGARLVGVPLSTEEAALGQEWNEQQHEPVPPRDPYGLFQIGSPRAILSGG